MPINYTAREEKANALTHALGALVVLAACISFLLMPKIYTSTVYVLAVVLYALGAGLSYLASAVYHSCPRKSSKKEMLRRLDHAAIYWHIAGSYSPVVLIGMSDNARVGLALFVFVWGSALAGLVYSLRGIREHNNWETACFVLMGLVVLLAFGPVLECIGWKSMGWIIAEGAMFVTGALFYSFNKIRYMHTVFHVFVLLGTLCHITALNYML